MTPAQELGLSLRWTGLMRLAPYPTDPSIEKEVNAFYRKSAAANAREARARGHTLDVAGSYRDLLNWPVVVLARELPEQTQQRRKLDAHDAYLLSDDGLDDGIKAPSTKWCGASCRRTSPHGRAAGGCRSCRRATTPSSSSSPTWWRRRWKKCSPRRVVRRLPALAE